MYLTVTCPTCGTSYRIAPLAQLPQPSKLTAVLADLHHGHKCSFKNGVDEHRIAV